MCSVQAVVDNFLPYNVSPLLSGEPVASLDTLYGVPLMQALRWIRVGTRIQRLKRKIYHICDMDLINIFYTYVDVSYVSYR